MSDALTRPPPPTQPVLPAVIATLVVIADRIAKSYVQSNMSIYDSVPVIAGWIRIVHNENPGAAFGVLAEGNAILRVIVLIGFSGLVMLFVAAALWGRNSTYSGTLTRVGLSLVLGGAFGNLWDRISRGTVTDFFEVYHGTWAFPAFNVADSAINVGACLLLLDLLRPKNRGVKARAGYAQK